jgi:hypothetical protein
MMAKEEEHISDVVEELKPQLNHFAKFYNNLSLEHLETFLLKDKIDQQRILSDLLDNNSQLEQLLRTIIDEDINAKTYYSQPKTNK